MYFWNTRQLALDLREGKVTEQDEVRYLFAYVIWTSISILVLKWIPSEYALSKIADIAELGVTIIGLLICYKANSRGDGREFVVRFICMSWPVSVRLFAAFVPLGFAIGVVLAVVTPEYVDPIADGLSILVTVVYFALIRRWLIRISATEGGEAESA